MIDLNFGEYYSIGDGKVKGEFVGYRFQYENITYEEYMEMENNNLWK